ncbi:MAG TPA: hypothetical protein VFV34_20715 [Blastocatellia bacterium]|nr:hypothetical protein [Blastocatellia bacterium]
MPDRFHESANPVKRKLIHLLPTTAIKTARIVKKLFAPEAIMPPKSTSSL